MAIDRRGASRGHMPPEDQKQVYRRYAEEVINRRRADALDRYVSRDVVYHAPAGVPPNFEGLDAQVRMFLEAFPDLWVTLEDMVAEGDRLAVRLTFKGTHAREFRGLLGTGKSFAMSAFAFCRFSNGRIVEYWPLVDQMGLMRQVGLYPPPKA